MPIGGGGPFDDAIDTDEIGRATSLMVFLRLAIEACEDGCETMAGAARLECVGMEGAAPMGGLGREGGLGKCDDGSVSDECDAFAAKNGKQS